MELTELVFQVNTDALEKAVGLLKEVEKSTADLGKAQAIQEDSAKKSAKSQKDVNKATEEATDKMSPLEKLLEKLKNQYGDLVSGFTKGEAAILQQARSFGAAEEGLKPFIAELQKIKELTKDPFDASVGAIRSVTAEFEKLNQRAVLAEQGISLSTKQLGEFSRIAAETRGIVEKMGFDPTQGAGLEQYNRLLAENQQKYLSTAAAVNALQEQERQRNNVLKEQERNNIALQRANASMMNDAVSAFRNAENEKAVAVARRMQTEATMNNGAVDLYKSYQLQKMQTETTMMDQALILFKEAQFQKLEAESKMMNDAVDLYRKSENEKRKAFEDRMRAEATMMDQAVSLYYKKQQQGSTSGNSNDASIRQQAQSVKWLANEEAKMISVVNSLNTAQNDGNAIHEKAARSIANYERHLRQAGVSGQEAADKLKLYKDQQLQIQKVEQSNQTKFLTRALQPQIGDVAVSLASGQNPLTVMLQQGDQIRGLIAQSGVAGDELRKVMKNAFSETLKSIKDTSFAMLDVFGGALKSTGASIIGLLVEPAKAFGTAFAQSFNNGASVASSFGDALSSAFSASRTAALSALPVLIGSSIIALGTLGVALYQVSKQEDLLSKSLILSGGSLGLNKDSAIEYATSLNAVGISTSKAIDVITAMANTGNFAAEEIDLVATAAVKMQREAGVAIADTVKQFSKLKEKPVDAIIELAIASGRIAPSVVDAVAALAEQGKQADAVALAMKAAADVQVQQAERIRGEYSALGSVIAWFGKTWTDVWDGIKGTQYKTPIKDQLTDQLKNAQNQLASMSKSSMLGVKDASNDPAIQKQKELIASLSKRLLLLDKTAQEEADLTRSSSEAAQQKQAHLKLANEYSEKENKLLADKFTRQEAIADAIRKANKELAKSGGSLSEEETQRITKVTGQEFDKKQSKKTKKEDDKKQRDLNAAMERYNDIMNESQDYSSSWNNDIAALDLLLKEGKKTQEEYNTARAALFEQQPYAKKYYKEQADAQKELTDNQKLVNDLIGKGDDLGKQYNSTMAKLVALKGKPGINPEDLEAAIKALEKSTPAAKAYQKVLEDYATTMDKVALSRNEVANAYSGDFVVETQKASLESYNKYMKSSSEAEIEYRKNISEIKGDKETKEYKDSVVKYKEMADAKKRLAQEIYDRETYLQSDTYKLYAAGFSALQTLATDMGKMVTDQFISFMVDGKESFGEVSKSFGRMVTSMIADLIRLRIQKQVTGLFDQLIGVGVQAITKMATPANANTTIPMQAGGGYANGGAFANGVEMFANGGAFTNSIVDSPTLFKFANGTGLMGEAGAEAIMPLKRDSSGSLGVVAQLQGANSGATSIVVNNFGSEKATATESVDSRGNRRIEVTIGEAVSGEMARSGSSIQRTMTSTYGMRPQLIRR